MGNLERKNSSKCSHTNKVCSAFSVVFSFNLASYCAFWPLLVIPLNSYSRFNQKLIYIPFAFWFGAKLAQSSQQSCITPETNVGSVTPPHGIPKLLGSICANYFKPIYERHILVLMFLAYDKTLTQSQAVSHFPH